ncbi:MAG: ComF family protein [Gemmatimonadota bacterium]|nr:MAG: ComF family protein [Gemmatimonadota bacterium]
MSGLADCIFPPFCLVCEKGLEERDHLVCGRCWSGFEIIDRPVCEVCGAPLPKGERRCPACRGKGFSFSGVRAAYSYSADIRKIIHAFKFGRKISLAKRLGRILAFVLLQDERFRQAECMVAVPLHVSRQRERGYNQSELLAQAVCAELGMKLVKDALVRRKRTKPQTALAPRRRTRNVEKAFRVTDASGIVDRKVVLVDDVFTTGATVDACAKALRRAGAVDVVVLTVTRAT